MSKAVGIGFGLNVGLRYKVNDYFFLEAGYTFDWMGVKKAYQPTEYKVEGQTPALHLGMITLNSTFFLSTGYALAPYVTIGAGTCPWRFTRKAFGGETWPAPRNPANDVRLDRLRPELRIRRRNLSRFESSRSSPSSSTITSSPGTRPNSGLTISTSRISSV